jgi:SAM-dependent methyltransferase
MTDTTPVASARPYTRLFLTGYDLWLRSGAFRFVWQCPRTEILALYNGHVTEEHLEVGPGSGYFLDRCHFPKEPRLTLLDASPAALAWSARRLARYSTALVEADIMEPLPQGDTVFRSVAMNCVLHLLPGALPEKARAIDNVLPCLARDGVLFGSTILADSNHTWWSRAGMRIGNKLGMLCNLEDYADDLEQILRIRFEDVEVRLVGTMGIFTAHRPRPPTVAPGRSIAGHVAVAAGTGSS